MGISPWTGSQDELTGKSSEATPRRRQRVKGHDRARLSPPSSTELLSARVPRALLRRTTLDGGSTTSTTTPPPTTTTSVNAPPHSRFTVVTANTTAPQPPLSPRPTNPMPTSPILSSSTASACFLLTAVTSSCRRANKRGCRRRTWECRAGSLTSEGRSSSMTSE
jgi:hypothetical protein